MDKEDKGKLIDKSFPYFSSDIAWEFDDLVDEVGFKGLPNYLVNSINSCYSLHKIMAMHWFINIHSVKTWHVKAGQPHITHNNKLQFIISVLHALGQGFPTGFGADERLPIAWIRRTARHNNLDFTLH